MLNLLPNNVVKLNINQFLSGKISNAPFPLPSFGSTVDSLGFNDLKTLANYLFSQNLITKKQHRLFINFDTKITNFNPAINLDKQLKQFENSVIERNDLTDTEKAPILVMSVSLRHNTLYWQNVVNDPANKWHLAKNDPTPQIALPCALSSEPIKCLCVLLCEYIHAQLGISWLDSICCFYL